MMSRLLQTVLVELVDASVRLSTCLSVRSNSEGARDWKVSELEIA